MKEVSKMGLKNLALFIGIIRGDFIELRDYDDIQDLQDGTKIIVFTPNPDQQSKFKELIAVFSNLNQPKQSDDFIGYVKPISNYINPNFLEKLGMYRQTQITKKSGRNKIASKKITPIINTKKHLFYRRKIPMASKK